ncbi:ABC transporter substrate-binding protein [Deinococcus aquiradiocola]|uniref:Peptide ABC transporter substrate-binding protein n=1 Tax=Deinococcus aquiradiocola TaxID=393059 RepID=A0A917PB20_9DEIO|nr:ABC transporter substrate-binding protein [Deinococcus aquiradiocola]GGJ69134.1 peptide ABC transporter substrate-binding protein [Deinococcus aquiradiocola]
MNRTLKSAALLSALALGGTLAAPARGGSMVVSYKDDVTTLDPAIGYDLQNWPIEKMVFDGLLDYKVGSTTLEPRLATGMPTVSADGRTYTFTLRPGVKFQNGREVVASDVVYTLTRVLDPKTKSPGQSFYMGIVGAQAFTTGKAKTVTGLKTTGKYGVTITLTAPNAAFLNVMAMNFAFVVPREEVAKYGADFGHHPVGTGPFRLTGWPSGQQLVFERNPAYFYQNLPYLDRVTVKVGLDPSVAFLSLTRGEVDLLGDGIPPAQFLQVIRDPKYKANILQRTNVNTSYLSLNTGIGPLKDVRVRQAINMAINKTKVLRLINGRGVIANTYLPPLMPGYDKAATGYRYDPAAAKALLKQAGYEKGFDTTLYTTSTDPNPRIAQSLQQDLAAVGIRASIKSQAQSTVAEAAGTPGTAPMVWSGGMAWTQDYPDPSDFYWPILSCRSAVQGGWNWPFTCDKALDAAADRADQMVKPAQATARLNAYAAIFAKLNAQAVWVPVYHEVRYMMRSDRLVGGLNELQDPIHNIVYERLSVKP